MIMQIWAKSEQVVLRSFTRRYQHIDRTAIALLKYHSYMNVLSSVDNIGIGKISVRVQKISYRQYRRKYRQA